ncbi:aldehyde dehydrogenase (NADP(+)) [Parvularcula flava]|uniref:2,5-dioxovalerate dehydrogenase n=1 Tax=Aquisalinus luteolus TaxID=1566827 RepID=A0A8J3A658_9PROT|nr:aldehyde dehydrogenase (NADP(+)) [Aquisalinus luteolus]NHK27307.1 aldehyde dehydrogenase (NADP(+)) [Aquisalinus luteolus]GGH95039.1 2,5-dioxovalerate dehydrogenase [Aquisalinus luteolus]
MTQTLTGANLIAGEARAGAGGAFAAVDPMTGETLQPEYHHATKEDIEEACQLAGSAAGHMAAMTPDARADLLETIAEGLEAIKQDLVGRVMQETALPQARVEGELGRTCGQLRLFAEEVRAGHWQGVRIDHALPDREPLPRPDLRQRMVPLGPVAVFGASNFPLAFSVAGGDTASAFAAGCPVIAKAHPAHPGTSELVGRAIVKALAKCGLPHGCFALVHTDNDGAGALVENPRIKAVGFTGSRSGGLAIAARAAARPEPIPVYAEMSSINPVLLMPGALRERGAEIGTGLAGSTTMGAGQFCTNPGLVFAFGEDGYDAFRDAAAGAIKDAAPGTMLTGGISDAYASGIAALAEHKGVTELARGGTSDCGQPAALFETDLDTFAGDKALQAEVFGAVSLIVRCESIDRALPVLAGLEGQLTITLQMEDSDIETVRPLIPVLEQKAGRLLVNGFPTGVEVCHAMVHGGPFPATSDGRTTSVGSLAINRFLRPVCYQNFPEELLPEALRDDNPQGLYRRVNGEY